MTAAHTPPPAEVAVAGAVLQFGNRAFVECDAAGLDNTMFTDRDCGRIFAAAAEAVEGGQVLDQVEILLGAKVGTDAAERISASAPAAAAFTRRHAEHVVGAYRRRKLATVLAAAQTALGDPEGSLEGVRALVRGAVEEDGDGAGRAAEIVDAAAYVDAEPPPSDPILEGCFEAGDKVGVIAAAKRKKTWLTMQLAVAVASGRSFLGWYVPRARRVLVVQLEIKSEHYHRRLRMLTHAMQIGTADLGGRLGVVNGRGMGLDARAIRRLTKMHGAELVILDPLYKMTEGDENKAQDIKPLLAAFDSIARDTGAAVLWVHHDAKGSPGDRDARDRGAGSNVLIRDVDQLFTLTPHRDDPEATVIETLARNHADEGPRVVTWERGLFTVADDLAPVCRTTANASQYTARLRELDAAEPGLSLAEAGRRLGCNKSTISRLRARMGRGCNDEL